MSASGLNEWLSRNRSDLHKQLLKSGMQEGIALMNAATGMRLLYDGRNGEQLCAAYLNEFRKGNPVQNNQYGLGINSALSQSQYLNDMQNMRNQALADRYGGLSMGNQAALGIAQQAAPDHQPEPNKVLLLLGEDE
jgi:hypothetical protein